MGANSHRFPHFPRVSDIEEIPDAIGPHVRLKVARLSVTGAPRYLTTIYAGEFSLEWMLDRFGGGDYHVRAFVGRRYLQSFTVFLDPCVPPIG